MSDVASIPVVVLGCFNHGGLAVVRSLGRLGVPVYAVHRRDRVTPAFFSRYTQERLLWDIHTASPQESLRFLQELYNRIGHRSVLIATSDIGAMFVADHAEQLSKWFRFPVQDSGLVRSLCSKKAMYYLAKQWNVATPETAFPCSMTDVETYLATARFPVLVKPIYSGAFRMQLVHTRHALLELCDSIWRLSPSNVMLQEYIPGGDEMTWTFNGYFDHRGDCLVASTGRKLRNYPPSFGAGCLGICVNNEQVKHTTIAFMKAIGYRGPLDLGYRYDVRDGCYKVNDINPRIGAMFRCFVGDNGGDIARAIYQDMTGQQVLPVAARDGRKWIVEDYDWFTALHYYWDGQLTLRGWLKSVRGVEETSYIARDDLWPLAAALVKDIELIWNRINRFKSILPLTESQRLATRLSRG